MQKWKNFRFALPASALLLAIVASIGIMPIFANPSNPTLRIVPAVYTVPLNGGTDFTVYVQVPSNPPVSGDHYNLYPAFVVQSINVSQTDPSGVTYGPDNVITCTTAAFTYENITYPGYPSRNSFTTCDGLYPGRVDARAYWGSITPIYFLGLVGFGPSGSWTITFIVTGYYYGSTITLTGSAHLYVQRS